MRSHVVVVGLLGALLGCRDRTPAPKPAPKPLTPAGNVAPRGPVRITSRQMLSWSNVRFTDNCFFFSGPDGRDDRLVGEAIIERDGTHIRMTVGGATFLGVYREQSLDLARTSEHEFDGPWLTTEVMHGVYDHGAMTLHYRYNECSLEGECPGRCTIIGDITLR